MLRREVYRKLKIPTWALCYLVNSDSSGLDDDDRKTVDSWVDRIREGGRIDVCCPREGAEPYFCSHPEFGLACDVEECDVIITPYFRYPNCDYKCWNQSRFEPVKWQALDGNRYWRTYDNRENKFLPGYKFKTRKECVNHIGLAMYRGLYEFEPDDDRKDIKWLRQEIDARIAAARAG